MNSTARRYSQAFTRPPFMAGQVNAASPAILVAILRSPALPHVDPRRLNSTLTATAVLSIAAARKVNHEPK